MNHHCFFQGPVPVSGIEEQEYAVGFVFPQQTMMSKDFHFLDQNAATHAGRRHQFLCKPFLAWLL